MATDLSSMTEEQKARKRETDSAWRRRNRKRHNMTDRRRRQRNPEKERARKRIQNANRDRTDGGRICSVCQGPISDRNKSGICAKTFECRSAQQNRRNAGKPSSGLKGDALYLLEIVYDLDTEEEIIDDVAINRVVTGGGRAAMTVTERKLALDRMARNGVQYREMADRIGTSPQRIKPILEELGYEVIPRRSGGGPGRDATEIRKRRVDRSDDG